MFRFKPSLKARPTPPLEPIDGFFFATRQSDISFGGDRANPTRYRPTLSIRFREGLALVLPATSKSQNAGLPWFFAISPNEVLWQKPESRPTFVYCMYETVPLASIGEKIGVVSQNTRMNIAHWLHGINKTGGCHG